MGSQPAKDSRAAEAIGYAIAATLIVGISAVAVHETISWVVRGNTPLSDTISVVAGALALIVVFYLIRDPLRRSLAVALTGVFSLVFLALCTTVSFCWLCYLAGFALFKSHSFDTDFVVPLLALLMTASTIVLVIRRRSELVGRASHPKWMLLVEILLQAEVWSFIISLFAMAGLLVLAAIGSQLYELISTTI